MTYWQILKNEMSHNMSLFCLNSYWFYYVFYLSDSMTHYFDLKKKKQSHLFLWDYYMCLSVFLSPYFCLILALFGDVSRTDENWSHEAIEGSRDILLTWVKNSLILVRYSLSLTVKSVIINYLSFSNSLSRSVVLTFTCSFSSNMSSW